MKNRTVNIGFAASFLTLATISAHGGAALKLHDGVDPDKIVLDNSVDDLDPAVGSISFNGSIGKFTTVLDAALTKPQQGSATDPILSLSFENHSSGPGHLTVSFTDTDFGPTLGQFLTTSSGLEVRRATGDAKSFFDTSNTPFGEGTQVGALGPFAGHSFDGEDLSPSYALANPYSVTLEVTANHRRRQITTGTAEVSIPSFFADRFSQVNNVPEGGNTAMLLGATLALFGIVAKRSKDARIV